MRLIKRKLAKNSLPITAIVAILAILSQIAMPFTVYAEMAIASQNANLTDLTIDQSPIGHIVFLNQNYPKPDKVVNSVMTAYTSTVDQCDDDPFVAAWGDKVFDGMIAANWLPRGTKIKIPSLFGDKIFTVADRMNARYGYGRLDIWMDSSKDEAKKFGVQRAEIEIFYPDNEFAQHNKELAMK